MVHIFSLKNRVSTRVFFQIIFEKPSSDSDFPSNYIFFEKPSSDSGFPVNYFLLLIRVPTRDLFIHSSSDSSSSFSLLIRVPTRDLITLFEPWLEHFIFFCWSGFRLEISLFTRALTRALHSSFVDPGSDSRSLYSFELWPELFIFLCWSEFRLVISLLYSSSNSSSSFFFCWSGFRLEISLFVRALIWAIHSSALIQGSVDFSNLIFCPPILIQILGSFNSSISTSGSPNFQFSNYQNSQFRPPCHPISIPRLG